MTTQIHKVSPGDNLRIPSRAYNAFVDAAEANIARQYSLQRAALQRSTPAPSIVSVRNESGATRERFDLLGIGGIIIKPVDNLNEFCIAPRIIGAMPSEEHAGKFVVLLEPLVDGAIGRAIIDGVVQARVRMDDEEHMRAEIADGEASELLSSRTGSVRLLWIEDIEERTDPEIAWAIVRLGDAGDANCRVVFIRTLDVEAGTMQVQLCQPINDDPTQGLEGVGGLIDAYPWPGVPAKYYEASVTEGVSNGMAKPMFTIGNHYYVQQLPFWPMRSASSGLPYRASDCNPVT